MTPYPISEHSIGSLIYIFLKYIMYEPICYEIHIMYDCNRFLHIILTIYVHLQICNSLMVDH